MVLVLIPCRTRLTSEGEKVCADSVRRNNFKNFEIDYNCYNISPENAVGSGWKAENQLPKMVTKMEQKVAFPQIVSPMFHQIDTRNPTSA